MRLGLDLSDQRVPVGVGDCLGAEDRPIGPQAQQDVGVVDCAAGMVGGIEQGCAIAERLVERSDDVRMRADAAAGKGAAARPVEDQAPGAFEKAAMLLVGTEIDRTPDLETMPFQLIA